MKIENFKLYRPKPFLWSNTWKLYIKKEEKKESSFLLYKNIEESKINISLIKKTYLFKWEMVKTFKTKTRECTFSKDKIKIGIFRFPLEIENSKKIDFLLMDQRNSFENENIYSLIDSKIISLDTNKINSIIFEVDEIPRAELKRVKKEWLLKGYSEVNDEINALLKFMDNNFNNAFNKAEALAKTYPDYLNLLMKVLDKKINIKDVEMITNNVITSILI